MNNTPTPMTDDGGRYCSHQRRKRWIKTVPLKTSEELERELAAVTEQRDEALSDLEFRRDLFVLQEQQLNDVRAERDRLAEALREITTYDPSDGQCNSGYSCKYIAEQALQSLNQPQQ